MPSTSGEDLLKKYDVPVPRYTSYPALPHWKGISDEDWIGAVERVSEGLVELPLSLYVHIPYCQSLCSFCGCTKVISKDKSKAGPLVDTLLKELDLKLKAYFKTRNSLQLKELHLGGGSPTWLPAKEMFRLISGIVGRFKASYKDIAIEVDPRTLTLDHVEAMKDLGVNRVSLGVQDFNELTLAAIKRHQSYEQVLWACHKLRENKIKQINFDLVYGLPYQTLKSIKQTMDKVLDLRPTRIALYSYAHIPHVKLAQRGVEKHGLPSVELKRALFEESRNMLLAHSYQAVGMDHFAVPEDELYLAHSERRLHRNFMGYTVQNTKILLGIGPSALSDCGTAYFQNSKDVPEWYEMLANDSVAQRGGHLLSEKELKSKKTILNLMCSGVANLEEKELELLRDSELFKDELLSISPDLRVAVTDKGGAFVRNICAELDPLFLSATHLGGVATAKGPVFSRGV
ncbi:MAG: oxygen-independent coproporphyrinogen III oxidase [Bdellovibrionota bacterium]